MSDYSWFALPVEGDRFGSKTTTSLSVRAWEPGDGLVCVNANRGKAHHCGVPVAVLERKWVQEPIGRWTPPRGSRTEVLCSTHVAEKIRKITEGGRYDNINFKSGTEKQVREEVLVAHWDEYQGLLNRRLRDAEDGYLSALPEYLRSHFKARQEEAEE